MKTSISRGDVKLDEERRAAPNCIMSQTGKEKGDGIWRKLSDLGTDHAHGLDDKKRVILANQGGMVGFILTAFYVGLYHGTGLHLAGWIALTFCVVYALALPLNKWGFTKAAPVWLLVAAHLHVSTLSYLLGKDAGIHFFLFPIAVAPFLFFSAGFMRYIWFILVLSVSLMTGLNILYNVEPAYYTLPANILAIIEAASLITGLMTTIALMYYLYIANTRVESKLDGERAKSEKLLLNILPREVAEELKHRESLEPIFYESVTIAFTDFQGFSKVAKILSPGELLTELDDCFSYFDSVIERYELEKLKTIGDSYMYAGGIPSSTRTHAVDAVRAALEIQSFMFEARSLRMDAGRSFWQARLGIHTGPLVAGVIGQKKFAYDVWGDTVNKASRMESSCEPGKVNVSRETYEAVKDFFEAIPRGTIITNKGEQFEMYFITAIKSELSEDGDGRRPNEKFRRMYAALSS